MCEILTVKGNRKGVGFTKFDIRQARDKNSDGAGYVIFEKKLKKWDVVDFETFDGIVSFYDSYAQYNPAWGCKKKKPKKDQAVNRMYQKQMELQSNQMMICHFRLSTSGHGEVNTQPILKSEYIVIHNGIFQFKKLPMGMSDTRYFTKRLADASKKLNIRKASDEKRLIERTLDYAGGSYSVFIYSFRTRKLYYIKNGFSSFNKSFNGLLGSTMSARFPVIVESVKDDSIIDY